jgi:hypothetical protein
MPIGVLPYGCFALQIHDARYFFRVNRTITVPSSACLLSCRKDSYASQLQESCVLITFVLVSNENEVAPLGVEQAKVWDE